MNDIKAYFHTDWASMTQHDWIGLIMTIAVFFIMLGLYVYVFHPANKERLEAQRYIPLHDGDAAISKRDTGHRPERTPRQDPKSKELGEQK